MAYDSPPPGNSILDKVPLPVIGGAAALVVIAVIIAGVALSSGSGDNGTTGVVSTPTAQRSPTPTSISGGLQTAQPTAVATADLTTGSADEAENLTSIEGRFVISRFGVDAPLTYRAVGPDGVMPNPIGPDDIAYYDFSAWPGKGGRPGAHNAVLAGHVDSGREACKNGTVPPPCQAVLWDLNELHLDDEIQLVVDGVLYKYAVISNEPVDAATGPWDAIVSATTEPILTIITCGGDFNRTTGEYTSRQVVRAKFIGEEPAPS